MKVVMDGQCFQSGSIYRGIGRYACGLLEALLSNNVKVKILLNGGLREKAIAAFALLKNYIDVSNIIYFYPPAPLKIENIGTIEYEDAEDLYVCKVLEEKPELFLIPAPFEVVGCENLILPTRKIRDYVRIATIVHDFIPYEDIENYLTTPRTRLAYKASLEAIGHSDFIFTNSNFVKNGCNCVYPKITAKAIYGGGSLPVADARNNLIQDKYFLYYGGLDQRKNVPFLIEAYSKLDQDIRNNISLYIIGGANKKAVAEIKRLLKIYHCEKTCKIFEYVSDEELSIYISNAYCFVFPSLYEGLGLPILEAIDRETPCLCSKGTALKEIYSFEEGQFDPKNSRELTKLLERAVKDSEFYARLLKYSRDNKNKFTWDKSAKTIINSIRASDAEKDKTESILNIYEKKLFIRRRSEKAANRLANALRKQLSSILYVDVSSILKTVNNGTLSQINEYIDKVSRSINIEYSNLIPVAKDPSTLQYKRIKISDLRFDYGISVEFARQDYLLVPKNLVEEYSDMQLLGAKIISGEI